MSSVPRRMEGGGWTKWEYDQLNDDHVRSSKPTRHVGMVRFDRADGLDPRVCPEENGTHLSRGAPHNQLTTNDGRIQASCGKTEKGFSDYGPVTGITCPDCAAMLAAMLLNEDSRE